MRWDNRGLTFSVFQYKFNIAFGASKFNVKDVNNRKCCNLIKLLIDGYAMLVYIGAMCMVVVLHTHCKVVMLLKWSQYMICMATIVRNIFECICKHSFPYVCKWMRMVWKANTFLMLWILMFSFLHFLP